VREDGRVHALAPTGLLGDWRLERTVHDRRDGARYDVTGTTRLTLVEDDHVRWTESGTMSGPTGEVPVSRTLDVVRGASGAWAVRFGDGREFHPWLVGSAFVHDCAPDVYRGSIDVEDDRGSWTVVWEASGPQKDYRMVSTLTRPDRPTPTPRPTR
jgi:hypothetical protein